MVVDTSFQRSLTLPMIENKYIYHGKYRDFTPEIMPAGKLTDNGDSTADNFRHLIKDDVSKVIKRFQESRRPEPGQKTISYGTAYDPERKWAKELRHGVNTSLGENAGRLLNPIPTSNFAHTISDKQNSRPSRPNFMTTNESPILAKKNIYGNMNIDDVCAGRLISPNKTYAEVKKESAQGEDLYRQTHFNYQPGERINRMYSAPGFSQCNKFGIETPHDNTGRSTDFLIKWNPDDADVNTNPRVAIYREKTQSQLGKVLDPIKETLNVPASHVFGLPNDSEKYGVGELIHGLGNIDALFKRDYDRGVISKLRAKLKILNLTKFENMEEAFKFYNQSGNGKISLCELKVALEKCDIYAEENFLSELMRSMNADENLCIDFNTFVNFCSYRDTLNEFNVHKSRENVITKQIHPSTMDHKTEANMIGSKVDQPTADYRIYGTQTIRSDKAAPVIKRIHDATNYGDEGSIFSLLNPNVFYNHGITEKDMFATASEAKIKNILINVGINLSSDVMTDVYKKASLMDPAGKVSLESFRCILESMK